MALHIRVVPPLFSLFVECPLVEYKGSGFLGISVVCGVFFIFQKVLDDRKSVIKPENFCLRLIRLKKCRAMGDIRWKKCNKVELFA